MRPLIFALSVLLAAPAFADESVARERYARGVEAYSDGRYEEALSEFEAAHAADPRPALEYNIALCDDKLGRKTEALAAYERFLATAPADKNVLTRVKDLRRELTPVPPGARLAESVAAVTVSVAPSRHRWIMSGAVGGGALALGAIGAGLLGSAASGYHGLASSCSPSCSASSWSSLPAREHAGEAFLGLAAAAAVVDVVLLARAARRK